MVGLFLFNWVSDLYSSRQFSHSTLNRKEYPKKGAILNKLYISIFPNIVEKKKSLFFKGLIFGYGGMRTKLGQLELNPILPPNTRNKYIF